ncbi:hypothetical protein KVF89_16290 [Nocardioides carbamazepini]|uniref:hypothetical protein n=1 Tax=Nocardioides carbamazepini TaxID=2854259 RepID=UPI002149A4D0|nr:hypothetical protein [Nocardioides carbamazepini]MCR1784101.1 hypothetical protein [Nocardioides carbamazepini]
MILTPAASFAGTSQFAKYQSFQGNCTGANYEAWAYFEQSGDKVTATDMCVDGHSAVTKWKAGNLGDPKLLWASGGAGDSVTISRPEIPEGADVFIKACIGEFGSKTVIDCTEWKVGVA